MPSASKSRVLRKRAKLFEGRLRACTIASACDKFLRSRGIAGGGRENFNRPNISSTEEEPKTEP